MWLMKLFVVSAVVLSEVVGTMLKKSCGFRSYSCWMLLDRLLL